MHIHTKIHRLTAAGLTGRKVELDGCTSAPFYCTRFALWRFCAWRDPHFVDRTVRRRHGFINCNTKVRWGRGGQSATVRATRPDSRQQLKQRPVTKSQAPVVTPKFGTVVLRLLLAPSARGLYNRPTCTRSYGGQVVVTGRSSGGGLSANGCSAYSMQQRHNPKIAICSQ
jgi:hypothetical protein